MTFSSAPVRTAIILAAGRAEGLGAGMHGRTSAAMIPINGQPVIHRTLRYLTQLGITRVIIGARSDDTRLQRFVSMGWSTRYELTWVFPEEERGPGYTLLSCLDHLGTDEPCLVVLGDTSFVLHDESVLSAGTDIVLVAAVDEPHRWCIAEIDEGSAMVRSLHDKPTKMPEPLRALIGVYLLQTPAAVRAALAERAAERPRLEISDALRPLVAAGRLQALPAREWLDAGNPDRLADARRHLVASREFNELRVDEFRGTITKRSRHREKFVSEIEYYQGLPERLRVFFPRIISSETSGPHPFVEMEYYGYPTLSEFWSFEDVPAAFWRTVVAKLGRLLDEFATTRMHVDPDEAVTFYRDKTIDRMRELAQVPQLAPLCASESLRVNGCTIPGWPSIVRDLPRRLGSLREGVAGTVIHGDLCFPNILFDPTLGLFRLIDPRGSFTSVGVGGDARYDAAKLLHSVEGGYDLLINDMFLLTGDDGDFSLRLDRPSCLAETREAIAAMVGDRHRLADVRLIEATLFLSMASLHAGRPDRQAAMALIGALLYHDALDNADLYRR